MVKFEMADLIAVIKGLMPYIISLIALLIIAIIVTIAVRRLKQNKKRRLVRQLTWLVTVSGVAIILNAIILGPMSTLVNLTFDSGKVTKTTTQKAKKLAEKVADNGFVLLKNKNNFLPLTNTKKINVFGWASTNPVYGGAGSGGMNQMYKTISLEQGLKDANFKPNQSLIKFYKKYASNRQTVSIQSQNWTLPEPPVSKYSKKLLKQSKDYSDTALIVISRQAGEGANDIPQDMGNVPYKQNSKKYKDFEKGQHYLELSHTERDMVKMVCHNFKNVVVVYNGAYSFELGFVNKYSQIKSAIWAPGPGNVGFEALGKILNGSVNPSGRTTDTFVYNIKKSPIFYNAEKTNYQNKKLRDMVVSGYNAGKRQKFTPAFINYVENIYVGYKYYETAATEHKINYDKVVQYPFGYGLSYTKFSQKMSPLKVQDKNLSFKVKVTNTGKSTGRDVVEVYYNPPYINGGVEKASANLLTFRKTKELKPGESQTFRISFSRDDMASYSEKDSAYILDKGKYVISINKSSHQIISSQTYELNKKIIFDKANKRSSDKVAAKNEFQNSEGNVTYLSRKDHFANLKKATAKPQNKFMPKKYLKDYTLNSNYNPKKYLNKKDKIPVTGKNTGLKLKDLRGKSYNDPKWDQLLDELTIKDMANTIALAGYQTPAAKSVGKVQNVDSDGPMAINNNFTHQGSVAFPIEVVIANTWSTSLAYKYGKMMAKMAKELGSTGWYAPGMNTHRSPFTARNYEYYSEDGTLAGDIAAGTVAGSRSEGVYPTIKHFAMYDSNGKMVSAWATEQAIRENYLKPFEIAVKKGNADAAMESWAFLGNKWVGENKALNINVLRHEWGFKGFIVSDYFRDNGHGFMNADIALPNGVDAMLSTFAGGPNQVTYKNAPSNVKYMRRAMHNILYTTVNSWAYNKKNGELRMPTWKKALIFADIVLALVVFGLAGLAIKKYRSK